MFNPGAILQVSFKNFVTYQEGTIFPGPRLNMLIGPNGTGKSAVVAAIILGLGGNPKIVGRGSKISEYVKSNCDNSEIKIVLKGPTDQNNVIIERHFNKLNKSIWLLNEKQTTMPEVLSCISKFNIQVDNLCQFLPQDKVQDFAKMTKQELLKQTLIALCRDDLVDIQTGLIKMGKKQRVLLITSSEFDSKVDENRGLNARLESKMKNIELRKEFETDLANIKRKLAWVQYDMALGEYRELEQDRHMAEEIVEEKQRKLLPFQKIIEKTLEKQRCKNEKCAEVGGFYKRAELALEKNSGLQERLKKLFDDTVEEKQTALRMVEERQLEIDNCNVKIKQLKHEQDEIRKNNDPEGGIAKRIATLESEQGKVQNGLRTLDGILGGHDRDLRNLDYEMRALNAENERNGSVLEKRLQWLKRNNSHAYEGAVWLSEHGGGRFKGEVYRPMMLELNVVDAKYCKYLESTIPYQDRIAFTCELKEDMNTLIRILRNEKRLSINVVHSANTDKPSKNYLPNVPIEQLRKYGLYAYLNTLISGPEPIMRYILKNYRLHDVPIGNDATNKQYEEIAKLVSFFYSGEYCFKKSGSRYDKSYSSIIQRALSADSGCLAITVNTRRVDEIRCRLEETATKRQQFTDRISEINAKVESVKSMNVVLGNKLKEAYKVREQCKNIDYKLKRLIDKCNELQRDNRSVDTINSQYKQKIKEVLVKLVDHQKSKLANLQALKRVSMNLSLIKAEIVVIRKQLIHAQNITEDAQAQFDDAKRKFEQIDEAFRTAANTAKQQLRRARNLSGGFKPSNEGFNQFRATFDCLPDDVEDLDSRINMLQIRIESTTVADEDEIREFERRNREIERWNEERQMVVNELVELEENISKSREKWLRPLSQLIDTISEHFGAAFEKMGCAGEVVICTAGQTDDILHPSPSSEPPAPPMGAQRGSSIDYALYGISVRVTYRNGEPLQELNTVTQSGGERSVATAAYMLALQTLTPVPFRCVDEINQGMDSANEERVFDLLVDCTMGGMGEGGAQYFFVTPKLNEKLRYVDGMKINIVHNGPYAVKQCKWKIN